MRITFKDWNRMLDLYLAGESGVSVASRIGSAEKAAARFVCGAKLAGVTTTDMQAMSHYYGQFSDFYNRAIQLGMSRDIILEAVHNTAIPTPIADKLRTLSTKKLNNRFVRALSKAVLDAGYDISYPTRGGNAITMEGRDAMARNGRKWTIGYTAIITVNGTSVSLVFDAITCEGGGSTYYVFATSLSSSCFGGASSFQQYGQRAFVSRVLNDLSRLQSNAA
jgi:hypothetical protein